MGCYHKYRKLAGLNNGNFSQFWRPRSLRLRCQHVLVLVMAFFLICRHLLSVSSHGREQRSKVCVSSYKNTNPIMKIPPTWHYLNLINSPSPHLQTASTYSFWGNTNIQPITTVNHQFIPFVPTCIRLSFSSWFIRPLYKWKWAV